MRMHGRLWAAATATLALLSSVDWAQAEVTYPYCAMRGGRGGYENCGFTSFAQCRETVRGAGGWCQINPQYGAAGYADAPPRRAKPRRYGDD